MSSGGGSGGGGGYYRFACCYRFEYNCPNWVWQKDDACGTCLSLGRPSKRETANTSGTATSMQSVSEYCVPLLEHGQLYWVYMTSTELNQHRANLPQNPSPGLSYFRANGRVVTFTGSSRGGRSSFQI